MSSNEGALSESDQELGVRNPIARSINAFFNAPLHRGSQGSSPRLLFVTALVALRALRWPINTTGVRLKLSNAGRKSGPAASAQCHKSCRGHSGATGGGDQILLCWFIRWKYEQSTMRERTDDLRARRMSKDA